MFVIGGMRNVSALFARQDGLATFGQLFELGVSDGLRRQRVARGEWTALDRTLVGLSGVGWSWRRTVRAAYLSAGTDVAVSHATAGRMQVFDGFDREREVHLTVCGSSHHTPVHCTAIHRSTLLRDDDLVVIDGMRVVSKPIALFQIGGSCGSDAARQALDGVLRDGASADWIRSVCSEWRRPGVGGPKMVLRLLDGIEQRLPRSWFQRLAKRVLTSTGVQFVDEHPVLDLSTGRPLAYLDLAAPELKIGVECQSWRWHSTPTARAADARRKRRLKRLGWEIIELWWADLRRPGEVLLDVEAAIAARRA